MYAPTVTAMIGLLLIIPAAFLLFAKLDSTRAALFLLVGSILFGPELVEITIPGIAPIDKNGLASLCAFIGLCVTRPRQVRAARLFRGGDIFLILLLVSCTVTDLLNRDELAYGPLVIPGFAPYHVVRSLTGVLFQWAFPFWIGRIAIRSREDDKQLLSTVVLLAVAYVPLILIELRMSPQMHAWVYGYAQHSFIQTIRAGGYRPMVFMEHGLALAIFLFVATAFAWMAHRTRQKLMGYPAIIFAIGLSGVMLTMKSFGSLIFLSVLLALIWLTSARTQLLVASIVAIFTLVYPLLRITDSFPTKSLVELSQSYEKDRGSSLEFRFMNEDILLAKALDRPYFGWGGDGRSRIYNSDGRDICVTDGAWIIFVGAQGMCGFLGRFLVILHPVWRAKRLARRIEPSLQPLLSILALVVTLSVVDLIPNGLFNVLPIMLAGALSGLADGGLKSDDSGSLAHLLAALLLWRRRTRSVHLVR